MRIDRSLFLAVAVVLSVSAPASGGYRETVLTDKPEAYWRLGESEGTAALDSSGNGHDARYAGVTLAQSGAIAGEGDHSVFFDGSGSIQRSDSAGLLPELDSWTVEAWVKVPATGREMQIVSWYPGGYYWGHDSHYALSITAQGLPAYALRDLHGNAINVTGTTPVTDSAWHHLVGSLDRREGQVKLYVDGSEVGNAPIVTMGLIADTGIPVKIGFQPKYWSGSSPIEGMMDEVAIYRGALSAERVRLHNLAGRGLDGDADSDGVPDGLDRCPATPPGSTVDSNGCITVCPAGAGQEEIDAEVSRLGAAMSSKEESIAALQSTVTALNASVTNKDAIIAAQLASIAALNAALTAKDQTIAGLNGQISVMYSKEQLDQALHDAKASAQQAVVGNLSGGLGQVFDDPGFALPGATVVEQMTVLSSAISKMPPGQVRLLHDLVTQQGTAPLP